MRFFAVSVVTLSVLGAGLASAADWPNYRGPTHDGVVAVAAPVEKLNFKQAWKVPIGDAFGQIAVAGNKAFVLAERGADEYAVALDTATGKEVWATRIDKSIKDGSGNGPRSTPTIDGKYVYITATYLKVACLDVETGKQVWMHDLAAEYGGKALMWGCAASPTIVGDLVLVVGGAAGKSVVAFKKETGELAWAKVTEAFTHATPTLATILGKEQAICFMKGAVVSVDPANGDVLWKYPFSNGNAGATAASPVVGGKKGDVVYCSAGYNVGAGACKITRDGDKWTAKELWRTANQNMNIWSTPVHRDGYIYGLFGHNDNNGPLACLDIETGQVKWSKTGFGSQGGLALVGDKLLVLTPKGDLVLVAAEPGGYKEVDRMAGILKAKEWTAPTYVDGTVYARNTQVSGGGSAEIVCLKPQ
jgi:outer membrane protein assembly factor BamB